MKQGIVMEKDNSSAIIMTNDGQFLSVPAKASWQIGETVTVTEFDQKLNHRNNKNNYRNGFIKKNKRLLIAVVASVLLFLMPFSLISEASTYVTLDINPSIEFEIKDDKVINMRALNSDGEKLITQINNENSLHSNSDIFSITSLILEEAEKMGYLKTTEENIIMVGVSENEEFKSSEYEQFIYNKLSENNLKAQVIVLSATSDEKKLADEKGISLGRQLLLEKEKDEGILISDEQIANESIKNIFTKIEEQKKQNNSENKKFDKNVNENVEKQDRFEDDKNENKDYKDKSSSTDKGDEKTEQIKQEEKENQNNEENKKKADEKKELEKKMQEEQKENKNDEKNKVEDKKDQTQQEEKNEENNQENNQEENHEKNEQEVKNDETDRDDESKEENSDNINEEDEIDDDEEKKQDDESEENNQDNMEYDDEIDENKGD